jgi:hypothetical protein
MHACILPSLLSLILVRGVTGFVPKLVVTTIVGTELGSLATKETALTGSQSWSEQQSGSYQECDLAGGVRATATRGSKRMMHERRGSWDLCRRKDMGSLASKMFPAAPLRAGPTSRLSLDG